MQVGDVNNNLNRADAVLSRANPKDLDLLVLPELAFSGKLVRCRWSSCGVLINGCVLGVLWYMPCHFCEPAPKVLGVYHLLTAVHILRICLSREYAN